jgi:glyoxylase-like metal-dependent hydrolase (beta-lactamase superfamily II)
MGNLVFEQIRVGGDRNFGYFFADRDRGVAAVIDPSYSPELFLERAKRQGLTIATIINTHGHHDHVNGNATIQEATGAKVFLLGKGNLEVKEGESLWVGDFELKVLTTPGHSVDHVVLFNPTFQIAITGDHLFVGKIGGTATDEEARQQYASFEKMKREIPKSATIWPGHDVGCRPASTFGLELATNPFLMGNSLETFFKMKQDWGEYKKKFGLI